MLCVTGVNQITPVLRQKGTHAQILELKNFKILRLNRINFKYVGLHDDRMEHCTISSRFQIQIFTNHMKISHFVYRCLVGHNLMKFYMKEWLSTNQSTSFIFRPMKICFEIHQLKSESEQQNVGHMW